jgi:hypothetical protein
VPHRTSRGRHKRGVAIEESPMAGGPVPRVINTDACRASHARPRSLIGWELDPEPVATKIFTVEAAVDVHGAAKKSRPPGFVSNTSHRFQRAQQHGMWGPGGLSDDVEAIPKAVNQINIGMAGRPEHDFGSPRTPARRMGRKIVRPAIGLGLYDAADSQDVSIGMYQVLTDEIASDVQGTPRVIFSR